MVNPYARESLIGIFPNDSAMIHLVAAVLADQYGECAAGRSLLLQSVNGETPEDSPYHPFVAAELEPDA